MGEIEQVLGREAATEVMAKVLTGTATGVTEDFLMASLQKGLAGLNRLDPNGANMLPGQPGGLIRTPLHF